MQPLVLTMDTTKYSRAIDMFKMGRYVWVRWDMYGRDSTHTIRLETNKEIQLFGNPSIPKGYIPKDWAFLGNNRTRMFFTLSDNTVAEVTMDSTVILKNDGTITMTISTDSSRTSVPLRDFRFQGCMTYMTEPD